MNKSDQQRIAQKQRELELEEVIESCDQGIKRIKKRRVSTVLFRKALSALGEIDEETLSGNGHSVDPDGVSERP